MDILEMTDLEIYELGIKELMAQIGPTYTVETGFCINLYCLRHYFQVNISLRNVSNE